VCGDVGDDIIDDIIDGVDDPGGIDDDRIAAGTGCRIHAESLSALRLPEAVVAPSGGWVGESVDTKGPTAAPRAKSAASAALDGGASSLLPGAPLSEIDDVEDTVLLLAPEPALAPALAAPTPARLAAPVPAELCAVARARGIRGDGDCPRIVWAPPGEPGGDGCGCWCCC
jgi:hypothetical protein